MAGALVQSPTPTDGGSITSLNRTFGSTTTSGNLLTAHGGMWSNAGVRNFTACADGGTNIYSAVAANFEYVNLANDHASMRNWYKANCTGKASHQITATCDDGNFSLGICEWSGVEASPTITTQVTAAATSAAPAVTINPSVPSLVIGNCSYDDASTTIAVGSGFTQAFEADENDDNAANNCEYKVTVSGSLSVAWTLGASRKWGVTAVGFSEVTASQDAPELRGRPFGQRGQRQLSQLLAQ